MDERVGGSIDTRQAQVECAAPDLVVVRFKAEMLLDVAGVGEMILAKRALCPAGRPDLLMVLPAEAEVDPRVMTVDQEELMGPCERCGRMAVVAPDDLHARMVEIYFRYHPREEATEVFRCEEDARRWLANEAPRPSLS